ncbi:polysaccharide deacetylase family protein [Simiduia curdlanivorans]|uniref:Polysaccharide deacetylase family protein n=1 Tax=Simiduia curdlanivorans TaxID=1492769 RepID=A0ABV8V924_9GAMM|nr:polysaccharide deacetylase family protein [Simiduia curdlanivorans]MDN3638498.1 polysaccharide deacetylase family protein [Simiduia curdlanivorans]
MIVSPETFDMHMTEIKRHFEVVALGDWVNAKKRNDPLPTKACAITFDDGWLDNYQFAFPILEKHQIPFTVFAVSEKIGTDFSFWPNRIASYLSAGHTDILRRKPLFASALDALGEQKSASKEHISEVINLLKAHSEKEIYQALSDLPTPKDETPDQRTLMNWQEIQVMVQSGLCTIGSHTCTHQRLNQDLDATEASREIESSKSQLEEQLNAAVDIFCYPNGDSSRLAEELVSQTYSAAVTTKRGIVSNKSTPLHSLPRIGLHEDVSNTADKFGARLSGWL